jgi:hypothetical protein
MNTTLNINRIGLLLKRYFIENKQLELYLWIIATVVFMIFHKTSFAGLFLVVAGFIFASNTFKAFSITPNGIHYLLIPATHAEKLIVSIILSTFYFFSMFLITYIIGTTLGTVIYNFILSVDNPINFSLFHDNPNQMNLIRTMNYSGDFKLLKTFISFAGTQSVFMLGSIIFKRSAAAKTILSMFGFFIVLFFIEAMLLKITLGTYSLNRNMTILSFQAEKMFSGYYDIAKYIVVNIIPCLLIPFFWIVTYFRLTEKQV